jgi:uncharacterized protein YjiK
MKRPVALVLGAALLASATVALWRPDWVAPGWLWAVTRSVSDAASRPGLDLSTYEAVVPGRVLDGIAGNASGLTFNRSTGTLFAVVNAPPLAVELSREGDVLRLMPIAGMRDPEGIAHIGGDRFVMAAERDHQLLRIDIDAAATGLSAEHAPRLELGFDRVFNRGLEGLAWDATRQRLFVAKEKTPLRILEISGWPGILDGTTVDLRVRDWLSPRALRWLARDLSSLEVHEPTGHLLVLSDESQRIMEFDPEGRLVGMLSLRKGRHGLPADVPQPEGLAIDPDGVLYVLSEPNLFYRFEPTRR